MSQCVHPHIFRMSTKDPYRCLGCGETVKVELYSKLVAEANTEPEIPETEEDLVVMKKDDAEVLHFCGRQKDESDQCPIFQDVLKKYKDNGGICPMQLGEYNAVRYSDGLIEYTLKKAGKLA